MAQRSDDRWSERRLEVPPDGRPGAPVRAELAAASPETAPHQRLTPFYALRFRNFRLFFIGQLISLAGTWMQTVAQQWLVFTLTHSAAWLGIVSGASALPYVVFGLWGGHVADRAPRRAVLVCTQTAFMVNAALLTILASNRFVTIQPWHVVALAAVSGVINAFNAPAQQAFVTEMVDERAALGNAIALNSLMFNMARFAGPVMAGAVLVKFGAAACFGLNALSFLAVIASLVMMRLPAAISAPVQQSIWHGFYYVLHHRSTLRVIILIGCASLFAWSFSTLFPVFAAHFRTGARGFTGLMAANGVGAATGGLTMAVIGQRMPRKLLVYGGAFLFSTALLLFTTAPSYTIALLWLVLCGFSMISFSINANTKVQEDVPNSVRGRVMAIYSLVFMGLMPLGGLEIGFLAEHVSPFDAVRINATICLCVTAAVLAWSQRDTRARHPRLAAPPE